MSRERWERHPLTVGLLVAVGILTGWAAIEEAYGALAGAFGMAIAAGYSQQHFLDWLEKEKAQPGDNKSD